MTLADSDITFETIPSTSPRSSAAIFARLLGYLKPYRARLFATLLIALAAVRFELLRPWPVQVVVDYGINGLPQPAWLESITSILPKADTDKGLIIWASLAAVGIVLAGAILSYLTLLLSVSIAKELVFTLSMQTFSKLQRLSLAYHSKHPTGDSLQRVSQDVFVLYFLVANVAVPGLVALITLAGMFFVLARLDLVMAFVTISVAPFLAVALAFFAKPMDKATNRQYAAQGAVMSLVEQSLAAIKVIQGFSREAYVQKKVEFGAREMSETSGTSIRISGAYNVVSMAITGIAAAVLLAIGAIQVQEGRLTLGELLVFLGYVSALFGPVTQLTLASGYAVQISARGRRVFEVLDAKEVVQERPDAIRPTSVSGKLEFRNVSFSYSSAEATKGSGLILEDISFMANPGELIAIVGPTGAGKTTLVALISRFFDPREGTILIDDIDIRDYSLTALREQIALVLQEPFLFPMSIADNIGFGRPSASRADIVAAAQAAHAHDFIMKLPDGYETVLDARAGNLSGGEKQRISIARAMLKDAPILILDEPTSALDAHTESLIFEALSTLMETRTTLLISHRLSTMRRANQVIVLASGKILERGTHESLLSSGQLYPSLYYPQYDLT